MPKLRLAVLATALLALGACADLDELVTYPVIIEDLGGQTIALDNGVCVRIDRTREVGLINRVAPSRCGI